MGSDDANSHYLDKGVVIQFREEHLIKLIQHFTRVVRCINIVPWYLFKITNKSMADIILVRSCFYQIDRRLWEF